MTKRERAEMNGVVCLWKYVKPKTRTGPIGTLWKLAETFLIDGDGYRIGKVPEHAQGRRRCHEWEDWTQKKVMKGEQERWVTVMGRAVTIWDIEDGVRLLDLTPPEWVDWISHDALVKHLNGTKNWSSLLAGGHDLYLGTARAVEDLLKAEPTDGG